MSSTTPSMSNAARTALARQAWVERAIVSGFIAMAAAALVLVAAYAVASAAGQASHSANVFVQWLYGLTHNHIVSKAQDSLYGALLLHVSFGLLWAGIYAYYVAPALSGPPWRRGLLFSLAPWLLSIVVFLPVFGGGFLGFGLGAGPLPIIGNLVLHAVYGVVLGAMYALNGAARSDANGLELGPGNRSEYGAALGIAAGAIVGVVVGLAIGLIANGHPNAADSITTGPWEIALFGAVFGAVGGALLGSMAGLTNAGHTR